MNQHNERAEVLLKRVVDTPPQGPEDTAIKFLAVSSDFEALYGNPYREALEAEARKLVA